MHIEVPQVTKRDVSMVKRYSCMSKALMSDRMYAPRTASMVVNTYVRCLTVNGTFRAAARFCALYMKR